MSDPIVFALQGTRDYGEAVAARVGVALAPIEERVFEDGEHKTRPLESVRGGDVYVIHSLHGDHEQSVDQKLVRLLFFLGALRDAGAASVTVVAPLLGYTRKDRRTQPRDPVTTRYVARLFEAVAVDRIVTIDVHNLAAYENAFRCRTEHLEARPLFVDHLAPLVGDEPVVVVSPDAGGMKRAERFRQRFSESIGRPVAAALTEKYRARGVVWGETFAGDVGGRTAIVVDDLIGSGTTLLRAAKACRVNGACRVLAVATHGLFTGHCDEVLADPVIERLVVTDTVPPFRLAAGGVTRGKLTVLETAPLVASAVRRLHTDGSVVALVEG